MPARALPRARAAALWTVVVLWILLLASSVWIFAASPAGAVTHARNDAVDAGRHALDTRFDTVWAGD